jgi:hypothetical protein
MADGLLSSILGVIDRQKQATKAGLGLLVSNPLEFAKSATARYFPTSEEVAQQRALEQSGGMAMNTPYMDKMFNLAQFQGSIKPIDFSRKLINTKVLDDSNNLKMVYHGTQRAPEGIKEFNPTVTMESGYGKPSKNPSGVTWFTEDPFIASDYASLVGGSKGLIVGNPTVYPSYLNIKNPATPDTKIPGLPYGFDPEIDLYNPEVVKKIKDAGYDGVVFSYMDDPVKNYIAFDNKQIFSPFQQKKKTKK